MAAISNIVLNDGQGTPVAHTFEPEAIRGDVAKWVDRSSGISLAFPAMTQSIRPPVARAKTRNTKVSIRLIVPTLEQTSPSTATGIQPAPTKAYDCVVELNAIFPERCTLQERKNIRAYLKNLFNHQIMTDAWETLSPVY